MPPAADQPTLLGRYQLHAEIASGGMASVHLGALLGAVGFARVVAIKRLHPHLAKDPEFVDMFLDEARLAARIRHPNVVATVDVVHGDGEIVLVMDYVEGESVAGLVRALKRAGARMPLPIAVGVVAGVLHGLQAAHEAKGLDGAPLGIVHRDVSPQNVLVGVDGVARLVDFGIALANVRIQTTREGQIKGKLAYMAPEQITRDERPSPASDLYSVGVVLWELCAGARAFTAESEPALLGKVLSGAVPRLERVAPAVPRVLADVAHRALRLAPEERFESAREMAVALEAAVTPASPRAIGAFVEELARDALVGRRALVADVELALSSSPEGIGPSSRRPPAAVTAISTPKSDVDTATGHTVATPPRATIAPRRRAAWIWIAVAGTVVGGAVAGWTATRSRVDGGSVSGAPIDAAPASQTAAAIPPAPPAITEPPPAASSAEVAGEPSPSASSPRRWSPRARPEPPAPKPAVKEGCDPPYYVDSAGIQRVKRSCFGR